MFDGIGDIIITLFVLCVIFVPLGIWKLVNIITWIISHVHINIT